MATDTCGGLPVYEIEKISGDNWRPGMKYREGFLVRYRRHPDFGWTGFAGIVLWPLTDYAQRRRHHAKIHRM